MPLAPSRNGILILCGMQTVFILVIYLFSTDLGITSVALINIILVKSPPRVKKNPPNLHVEAVCLLPPYVVGPETA